MTQELRALTTLPEDPGSIPSTHMAVLGNPTSIAKHQCRQKFKKSPNARDKGKTRELSVVKYKRVKNLRWG